MTHTEWPSVLEIKRDRLVAELWSVLRDIEEITGAEKFDDADLELWTAITCHPAIQRRHRAASQ